MLDKTVIGALLRLRVQVIHDRLDGHAHVNALLAQRGVDPAAHLVRAKRRPDAARKGSTRAVVLDALLDGSKCKTKAVALLAARKL
ncbi:MAG: hypothetical protein INF93_11780 [Rhodobacter sp.]|nr:hypothetical protein [Rhodobacter sp.]